MNFRNRLLNSAFDPRRRHSLPRQDQEAKQPLNDGLNVDVNSARVAEGMSCEWPVAFEILRVLDSACDVAAAGRAGVTTSTERPTN